MRILVAAAILCGFSSLPTPAHAAGGIQAENLRCEHLVNPLGIDTPQPRLSWTLRATPAEQRGQMQTAYQILMASNETALAAGQGDLWDSGKVPSDACAEIVYADRSLVSYQWCYWKVRVWNREGVVSDWSEPACWSMGILDPKLWQGKWLGYTKTSPSVSAAAVGGKPWAQKAPSPLFRKNFDVKKPVVRATAVICGLGYYELRLNGGKVGDRVLDPKFTRYDRRALYATYDVTRQLTQGKNAVGVMLGNGFYNPHAKDVWNFERSPWRAEPALLVQLRIDYADGTSETVASDSTWRASTGPLLHDGVRNGEDYDARREMPGWDTAAFDDSAWENSQVVSGPKGILRAAMAPPIRVMETIKPLSVTEPKPGVFIFDMGQNFAGWAQLKVSGTAGTKVTLRYGERLANGNLDRKTIDVFIQQGPFQADCYTLKGQGEEVWEPRFTYHGFRWVEVTGFPGKPTCDNLRGRVVHTSFTPAGSFECSNELLNKIQQMTLWSYRSNFVGIPTDCPQREKNGWTGDAHLAAEQAMYNYDNVAAYEAWMNDFKDEQRATGELPGIVPTSGWGYTWGNGPAWDCAYLLIPWYLYQYQGDTRVLADHYDQMKRYVDYLTRRSKGHIVNIGLGDWLPAKTQTPVDVTSTGYYYVDALILSKIARLLGKEADAKTYAELAEKIRQAFRQKFCRAGGAVANNSQTALSCAIYQDLARSEDREAILKQLVANVEQHGGHLDTGILGAKYLFHALTDNGRVDVAYRIATQTTPPSYGSWIARGATTLWEDWHDGDSRNHVMFGDISAWFYKALAGINLDPDQPAFKHIIIRPRPTGDLKWVKARYQSVYGPIEVAWKRSSDSFSLDITVPVNTTATVYVPAKEAAGVTEGGKPAEKASNVKFLRLEEGAAVYEVGSGSYSFVSTGS
ncbi:MAG: glycoside hydrolase family 78 protein [Planctomycetota bacterium]